MAYRARALWSRSVRSSRRSHDLPGRTGKPSARAKGHRCSTIDKDGEVREMRDAAAVLEIIRERGRRGLPLERVYRCLFNPDLYLLAYGKIYRNAGAMTPGTTSETVDGMNLGKIEAIITALRQERYRWTPVRRTYIEKKGTKKKRPLGLPTWSDKLLQEVIRLLLEAYYEPQFSGRSHGFRPGRGCHTALQEIYHQWRGTVWFIEGDITDCFGSLDHSITRSILAEKIHDGRFLRLIDGLLQAGYLEDWRYHQTLSGCPQGGVVSPVLSNIYLDRLDTYIEQTLLPAHNRGARRTPYRPYMRLWQRAFRLERQGEREAGHALRKQMQAMPSRDPDDPGYRRLRYCRYADDWLLGFTGPPAGGRADQGLHRTVPARPAQTGAVPGQDPDHPRADAGRPVPRLPDRGSARRPQARSARSPQHQRGDRAESTGRRDPRQMRALPAPRQADPANRTHRRYRLQYRRAVPGRVPGCRGVLPAGFQPSPARAAEVRHGTVTDQDPGPQVPDQGSAGLPPLPCRP